MIEIPENEIKIETSRSGGPGGQHVNKTSSRVTLRWQVSDSTVLNSDQKERVLKRLSNRINQAGELVFHVSLFRSQILNRDRAYQHLNELIAEALKERKKRHKTRPSKASKARRLESKTKRGLLKKDRTGKWE